MPRHEFNPPVKRELAMRAAHFCSNPHCLRLTAGPRSGGQRGLGTGHAAHICAAAEGGPRYDPDQSETERRSRDAHSDLWRTGDDEPEMIRWLSWGKENFARACDVVHFERGTKQRYGLGPIDQARVEEGLRDFRTAAATLEAELSERDWLVENSVSYADFRMATFLPFNDVARLPLDDYPSVSRWYRQFEEIDAWRDPFKGLDVPELPAVPGRPTPA